MSMTLNAHERPLLASEASLFPDGPKSNAKSISSSQFLFVEDPPTHHHPTHKDSDSLFFPSNALITIIRMITIAFSFLQI